MADNTINYNLIRPSADDFYNIQEFNDNMTIIDTELKNLDDGKAPSGHGLGTYAPGITNESMLEAMKRGCGFYQVQRAADTPSTSQSWISLLQTSRGTVDGKSTGFQIAAFDYYKNNPQMWFRIICENDPSVWNEMLHTGNIGNYANTRIATGTYMGSNSRTKTLSGIPFKAEMILIFCTKPLQFGWKTAILNGIEHTVNFWDDVNGQTGDGSQRNMVTWSGNTVSWSNNVANSDTGYLVAMNDADYLYWWIAFGVGKGGQ